MRRAGTTIGSSGIVSMSRGADMTLLLNHHAINRIYGMIVYSFAAVSRKAVDGWESSTVAHFLR
ncbi:MAG: hypothetical protein KDA46_10625, partial [Parvularculaceae bacterium]|nr:hypothetical protein [Parvularculaceae bacterium]